MNLSKNNYRCITWHYAVLDVNLCKNNFRYLTWHYAVLDVNLCKNNFKCLTWHYAVLDVNLITNFQFAFDAKSFEDLYCFVNPGTTSSIFSKSGKEEKTEIRLPASQI